jgi:hypothetical protein
MTLLCHTDIITLTDAAPTFTTPGTQAEVSKNHLSSCHPQKIGPNLRNNRQLNQSPCTSQHHR